MSQKTSQQEKRTFKIKSTAAFRMLTKPALCHTWDHLSLSLIPAYKSLSYRQRPCTRLVKVWTKEAILALKDCFEDTDWGVFAWGERPGGTHSNSLIHKRCGEKNCQSVPQTKTCGSTAAWGPCSNPRTSRPTKHEEGSERCKAQIQAAHNDNSRCRWPEITLMYHYKDSCPATNSPDSTLLDTLNHFFSHFGWKNREASTHPALLGRDDAIQLHLH